MIRIHVTATDTDSLVIVNESFNFLVVPRVGERVILDNRGGYDSRSDFPPMIVTDVISYAEPKVDVANPLQYVELFCKAIG
jgi:hypothetical protein